MNALHTWAHVQDLAECIDQSTNRRDIECALDDLEYRVEILNAEPCRPANALVERPRAEPGPSRPMSNKHLCYGMRRLNPFQGILQVSELGHARAVRLDDVQWEVQVRCAQPEHTWRSTNEGEPLMRYLRFGAWSLESGLRQVPLSPFLDIDLLLSASGALVEVLAARLDGLPFALTDHQQLWLLVGDGLPVALLATSVDAPGDAGSGQGPWVTAARSDHIFKPHRLAQRGIAVRQGPDPRHHALWVPKIRTH